MIYVLYKNSGVYSGRALRKALQANTEGIRVRGGFPKHFAQCVRKRDVPSLVINLGTTEDLPVEPQILNIRDMVRAAANKKEARKRFEECGIPAPRFFESARTITTDDLPVIGRTSYHSKGKGFWFCPTLAAVQRAAERGATHFLQFIPNTREYRVHTFLKDKSIQKPRDERQAEDYVSVKVSEKVWQGTGTPPSEVHQKNHEFGWTFLGQQNRREEELDVVRTAAKAAAAALGMDFGAVDVMYSVRRKQAFVLEVNSTPSLANEQADTCERYANRFARMLEAMENPES